MNKVKASLLDWVVAWVLSVLELAGMVLLIGLLMAGCARCARCLGVEYGTTFVSPAPDGQVAPGAGTVTARCAGVDTATVYDGATVIGTLPYFPPYTLSHTWSGLGAHVVRAVGCDVAGRLVTNTMTVVVVESVSRTVAPGRSAGGGGGGGGSGGGGVGGGE